MLPSVFKNVVRFSAYFKAADFPPMKRLFPNKKVPSPKLHNSYLCRAPAFKFSDSSPQKTEDSESQWQRTFLHLWTAAALGKHGGDYESSYFLLHMTGFVFSSTNQILHLKTQKGQHKALDHWLLSFCPPSMAQRVKHLAPIYLHYDLVQNSVSKVSSNLVLSSNRSTY